MVTLMNFPLAYANWVFVRFKPLKASVYAFSTDNLMTCLEPREQRVFLENLHTTL
jgi:hypothetical protein